MKGNFPPSPPSLQRRLMGKAADQAFRIWNGQNILLCASLMHLSAELPETFTADRRKEGRSKICIFVPVCYGSVNASRFNKL